MVIPRKVAKKKVVQTSTTATEDAMVVASGVGGDNGECNPVSISLGAEIVISNVQESRNRLLQEMSGASAIVLDGGEIEHIDGTGLQLLVALMQEAGSNQTTISWKAVSDVLQNNARQLGLTVALGLDRFSGAA
jgi:anti-anti-sigma regulatory factor